MLVLSRKADDGRQSDVVIHCPDGTVVTVTLVAVDCGKVRLGFTAPKTVRIDRGEIADIRSAHQDDYRRWAEGAGP